MSKKLFPTDKKESNYSAWYRRLINWWPCIWCSGGRVTFTSGDFQELHVALRLGIRTRNRVGTVFGGSIYSSVDPYFMLMFMEILGKDYVVWDKGASVKFIRPITGRVKCRFLIQDELVARVKAEISANGQYIFELPLQYEDEEGRVYATFTKTVYAASKSYYKSKKAAA
jgi:acyl-coenzyme A thioesterase PaaI-like protein